LCHGTTDLKVELSSTVGEMSVKGRHQEAKAWLFEELFSIS